MYFLYLLTYLSLVIQAAFITVAVDRKIRYMRIVRKKKLPPVRNLCPSRRTAVCLCYLAELVEEHTATTKYVISWAVVLTTAIHIGLIAFEDLDLHLNILGLIQQCLHGLLLRDFPIVKVTGVTFIASVINLVTHHVMAFRFFGKVPYMFSEVLAYFIVCLWLVPFGLFVSLSANDYVLPTTGEKQPLLADNNVLTDYLSRKGKRYSLLSFFNYAKESILPQRNKKAF